MAIHKAVDADLNYFSTRVLRAITSIKKAGQMTQLRIMMAVPQVSSALKSSLSF